MILLNAKRSRGVTTAALALAALMAAGPALAAQAGLSPEGPSTSTQALPEGVQFAQRRAQPQPQQQRGPETPAPAGAGGAGRYAMLREENKDSGCLVNLMQSGRAQLGPGCRDQGVVVFDPIGWTSGRNALILRARKGHRITFAYQPDGTWLRDPADKRPLALRKY